MLGCMLDAVHVGCGAPQTGTIAKVHGVETSWGAWQTLAKWPMEGIPEVVLTPCKCIYMTSWHRVNEVADVHNGSLCIADAGVHVVCQGACRMRYTTD